MAENQAAHTEAVKSGKRGVFVALAAVVVVLALLGVAYAFLGGDQLVADLFGGGTDEAAVTPTAPKTPTPEAPSTAATPSAEATGTSSESTSAAIDTNTGTSGSISTAAKPPTGDQASRMYWEQVASQEQIGKLVRGEISSMKFGAVTRSGSTANVRVTVAYKAGGSLSGTMVLRDYSGVWYFSSIARDANPLTVSTGKAADLGIVSTIVSQQAANQTLVNGIINGAYKTCSIVGVSSGSGTATVKLTMSGGTAATTAGSIVCVSKVIGGTKHWFITSFTKN
ncbi:MAG: hypothetical protein LLG08_10560 [Actinomycetia bacterium]|nr:hypothetical protein [Actinomycetes bacterium]